MRCEECETALYEAGEPAPAGAYLRVDDNSFHRIVLARTGPLPASFDGHIATYRRAAATCACQRRHAASTQTVASSSRPSEPSEPSGQHGQQEEV